MVFTPVYDTEETLNQLKAQQTIKHLPCTESNLRDIPFCGQSHVQLSLSPDSAGLVGGTAEFESVVKHEGGG